MWNGKVTDELLSTEYEYGEMFTTGAEGYENVDYEELSYDEFLALLKLSIEQNTELPVTIHKLLGDPVFVE